MGGIAEMSVAARGVRRVMGPCGRNTGLAPPIVWHTCTWTCEHAGPADLVGSRPMGGIAERSVGARGLGYWECDRGGRALPAEVEFTAIQCGLYSCEYFRLLVCVRDRELESAVAGLCMFPGCAVATPRTGVPSQGQCIPPIARARFGAPRRCDALRFLLLCRP